MSNIQIIHGDSLEAMKAMPDKAYDLCLTDPPYGVNLQYNTYQDTEDNWFNLMDKFIPEAKRIAKMVIMPSCQIKRLGWFYNNHKPDWLICWHKGSTGCVSYIGFNDWEPLVVYGKTMPKLFMHDFLSLNNEEKMGNHNHPCPKPLGWAKWLMKRALPNGGSVIDPFCGSGTSAIAADIMGFDFTGYEIDKDYYEAALDRFNRHKQQTVLEFCEKRG